MDKKLLSICIPTYNRADILDITLSKLVSESAFLSGKIELCISDNASPDHTPKVIDKYAQLYPNIIHSRNTENTGVIDGNFPIVASLATGTFIKFLNDYAFFLPGELDKLIEFVEAHKKDKPVLFFSNSNLFGDHQLVESCYSLDSFVSTTSYFTTWVLAAGLWRQDFLTIKDRDRSIEKFMWCPDNYLRLVNSGRKAIVYNAKFCEFIDLKTKGGYNSFYIFGVSYLSLYDEYLKSGALTKRTYQKEKYRLFRYCLLYWYRVLVVENKGNFTFDKNNALKFLVKNYKFHPYFYLGISYLHINHKIKQLLKK